VNPYKLQPDDGARVDAKGRERATGPAPPGTGRACWRGCFGLLREHSSARRPRCRADAVGDVPDRAASGGLDEARHVEPLEAMMPERNGTLANRRPRATRDRLQADAKLIRPDLDCGARMLAPFIGGLSLTSGWRIAAAAASPWPGSPYKHGLTWLPRQALCCCRPNSLNSNPCKSSRPGTGESTNAEGGAGCFCRIADRCGK